jgi:histidyl-tRNA synthetase
MHVALEKITYLVGRFESAEGKRLLNLENEDARSFGHAPRRCDVYIGSFGTGSKGSMEDRVEIAGDLWGAGLRADLMYDDGLDMALEEVTAECLAQGVL